MKIAEITLSYVSEAANANDFAKLRSYVEQYRKAVTDARDTMMKSGLDPHKKSGGYKAVEIALRKQIRVLQDIARGLTVDERQPVDEAIDLTSKIRDEFVHALFGWRSSEQDALITASVDSAETIAEHLIADKTGDFQCRFDWLMLEPYRSRDVLQPWFVGA